jgi:2-aminoadipate transaminase
MPKEYASRIERVRPSAIRELLRYGDDPSITSFGGAYPDPALFPIDALRQVYDEVLRDQGRSMLQYSASIGLPGLRASIAERMAKEGVDCGPEDVLILQGAQQGLDLVAKLLIDRGDVIVTENPTFLGALIAFNPYEPDYAPVDTDSDGMDMDALQRVLKSTSKARFIYVIPDFQNPTGVTLSLERRHRLLALADEYDIPILEDSPYRQLRYEGDQLPTLKSLDKHNRVIHLGSFSKTLAPGMRMGWATASQPILEKLGLLKLAADTQSSTLNMAATARFLTEFDLDAHIVKARAWYRRKRDTMLTAMAEHFPSDVTFTRPEGGLFTWVTFPEGFDTAAFMLEKSLPHAKVAFVPGGTFFPLGDEPRHARFSYSGVPDDQMSDAIARLGALITQELSAA